MYREQHFSPRLPQTSLKLTEFYLLSAGIEGTFIFLSKALSLSLTRVYSCVTDATFVTPSLNSPQILHAPVWNIFIQLNSGANPSMYEALSLIPTKTKQNPQSQTAKALLSVPAVFKTQHMHRIIEQAFWLFGFVFERFPMYPRLGLNSPPLTRAPVSEIIDPCHHTWLSVQPFESDFHICLTSPMI